jgi:hypothetical protein
VNKVHAACLEVEPTTLANGRANKRIEVEAAGPISEQGGSSKHDARAQALEVQESDAEA